MTQIILCQSKVEEVVMLIMGGEVYAFMDVFDMAFFQLGIGGHAGCKIGHMNAYRD